MMPPNLVCLGQACSSLHAHGRGLNSLGANKGATRLAPWQPSYHACTRCRVAGAREVPHTVAAGLRGKKPVARGHLWGT